MSKCWVYSFLTVIVSLNSANLKAQSFGFGCLGLVGGYGGYSFQIYQPTGLNSYIENFNLIKKDSLKGAMQKFGKSSGYRVGINFFRADLKGLILTAKGFYQFLGEKNSVSVVSPYGTYSNKSFDLNIRSWGIGFDLGTSVSHSLSWKVIDASLLFNSAQFTNTTNNPRAETIVNTYKTDKQLLGYSVGTGFILSIIGHYVSLEGFAGYSFLNVDRVKQDDNTYLPINESSSTDMKNFIVAGGFNAVIQLNVGFPL